MKYTTIVYKISKMLGSGISCTRVKFNFSRRNTLFGTWLLNTFQLMAEFRIRINVRTRALNLYYAHYDYVRINSISPLKVWHITKELAR